MTAARQQGFTVIEAVISLAIISAALVTILTIFNRTLLTAEESEKLTTASMIAFEQAELAGMGGLPEPGDSGWVEEARYPGYSFKKTVSETAFKKARHLLVQVRQDDNTLLEVEKYLVEQ